MKIKIGDKEIEGEYVQFDAKEEWTEILLTNGYQVKMKLVIASVFVGKDKEPATGVPMIQVFSNTVISVLPPVEKEMVQ